MRSDHDIEYRGVYFERLERIKEIMRSNPDYNEAEARSVAREHARKLTGGTPLPNKRSGAGE